MCITPFETLPFDPVHPGLSDNYNSANLTKEQRYNDANKFYCRFIVVLLHRIVQACQY